MITTISRDNIPEFIPDVKVMPVWKGLERSGKKFLEAFALFMHFMYRKDGLYYKMPKAERIVAIDKEILSDVKSSEFMKDPNCLFLMQRVEDTFLTDAERVHQNIQERLVLLAKKLQNIPFEKDGVYEHEVTGQDGQVTKVKVSVTIDNSIESMKSLKLLEELLDFNDRIEARIKKEEKSSTKKKDLALFDL